MSNDKPWFKFNVSDWMTGDIRFLDLETQAVFINLCALIWREGGSYKINPLTHKRLNTTQQVFNTCLQTLESVDIVLNRDGILSVKFLTEQLEAIELERENKSKAGKISAEKRKQSNSCQQVSTIKKEDIRDKKEDIRDKKEENRNKTKPQIHDEAIASVVFPDYFTVELERLFYEFANARRDDKKYMTSRAITAHFNQLDGFNALEIKEAYNKAIASGWQSVNPKHDPNLKQTPQKPHDPNAKPWEIEDRNPTVKELIGLYGIESSRKSYPQWFDENGEIKEEYR